jgi:hypothetical protein
MNVSIFVFFILACSCIYGQAVSTPGTSLPPGVTFVTPSTQTNRDIGCGEDSAPEHRPSGQILGRCIAIREYMRYKSPISPVGDMVVSMMGDETAFFLSGLIGSRPPLTPAQTLTVLDLIHNSFKKPAFIRSHADRKPEKSLALLKMLQTTAVDQTVKERIATETTFLTTLPETITPVQILNLPSKPGVMPMQGDFPKP